MATLFCEIFPLILTTVHTVKSKGEISQNFVAFSEYMNFTFCERLGKSQFGAKKEKLFSICQWVKNQSIFEWQTNQK